MKSESSKHILTPEEAFFLLESVNKYFANPDVYLQGQHRTEIVADAMLREGYAELAYDATQIHNVLREFHRGDYKAIAVIVDSDAVESFLKRAKGTRFAQAAEALMEPIIDLPGRFADYAIDWKQTAPGLAQVKQEKFPGDLTMIEKLNLWHGQQSQGMIP